MKYSYYIDLLMAQLASLGVRVDMFAFHLPDNVRGRCHCTPRDARDLIEVNESDARLALMTLAHEAGHFIANKGFRYRPTKEQRERQAIVFGWYILAGCGAGNLFTRQEWIDFHK